MRRVPETGGRAEGTRYLSPGPPSDNPSPPEGPMRLRNSCFIKSPLAGYLRQCRWEHSKTAQLPAFGWRIENLTSISATLGNTEIFLPKCRMFFIFEAGLPHVCDTHQWVTEAPWNHFRRKPILFSQANIVCMKITAATIGTQDDTKYHLQQRQCLHMNDLLHGPPTSNKTTVSHIHHKLKGLASGRPLAVYTQMCFLSSNRCVPENYL